MNNSMRYTLSFELYSDEELESCWYAEEDYTAIRRSCSKQIKKMNEGKELKDKKYCSRGLETYTKAKNETKKLTRRLAIDVVLYEQDRQRGLNIMSEEIIAQNYMAACASSQMLARNLGLGDQKAAEE